MKRMDVDYNEQAHGGMLVADPDFATEDVQLGDWVVAYDLDDPDLHYGGQVAAIDNRGLIYIRVDWNQVSTEDPIAEISRRSAGHPDGISFATPLEGPISAQPVSADDQHVYGWDTAHLVPLGAA